LDRQQGNVTGRIKNEAAPGLEAPASLLLSDQRKTASTNVQNIPPEKFRKSRRLVPSIRAELTGSDTCSALGITVKSESPVLGLCRKLIEAGHDPATPVKAYRGDTLCLRLRSIGEAAALEISSKGTGFKPARAVRTAPPMRQTGEAAE
jgi:hypothetical protein